MKKGWKLGLALMATVIWLWFIFSRSAANGDASHNESTAVLELLGKRPTLFNMLIVRKGAHFLEFFILGSLVYLDWRFLNRGTVLLPLSAGLLFAALDELLQTFIPGRSGQLLDVLIDFCGVAAGVGAGLLLRRWREARRRAKG